MAESSSQGGNVPTQNNPSDNVSPTQSQTTRQREISSPPEPFPSVTPPGTSSKRSRGQSNTSSIRGRFRSASKKFEESNPPLGFMDAAGTVASSIPTLSDIRRGSYGSEGWSEEGQIQEKNRRESVGSRSSSQSLKSTTAAPGRSPRGTRSSSAAEARKQIISEPIHEHPPETLHVPQAGEASRTSGTAEKDGKFENAEQSTSNSEIAPSATAPTKPVYNRYRTEPFDNGYEFPPKHTWTESTVIGAKGFWKFCWTWLGFFVVLYGLNIVAWGGMLFLLLCNAAPAMCHPDCNDINSPRRIWIEIDSQILTALFCVTGFGLIPWRFRDLWYLIQFRFLGKEIYLRRLAGVHRGWFRLQCSDELPPELGPKDIEDSLPTLPNQHLIPYPPTSIPDAPLTGLRASPTAMWKLDYVIWMYVWNTFLQAVLSGLMWGMNRYDRPSWSVGTFVALACIVAALGGLMVFVEGKRVKKVEGVPVSERDRNKLARDRELGIRHWNNIDDAGPKEEKEKRKWFGHEKATNGEKLGRVSEERADDGIVR